MVDNEKYLGEEFESINDIPEEVINDDDLAVVNLGIGEGHRVITKEEYEP